MDETHWAVEYHRPCSFIRAANARLPKMPFKDGDVLSRS